MVRSRINASATAVRDTEANVRQLAADLDDRHTEIATEQTKLSAAHDAILHG